MSNQVRLLTNVVASLIAAVFAVVVVSSWEPAGFAMSVTIREIARVHLPHFRLQVAGLALATIVLGQVLKALGASAGDAPAWRQRWLWGSVLLAATAGVIVGAVDAFRRGLGLGGGLFEAAWAAISFASFSMVCLVGHSSLQRGGSALFSRASRPMSRLRGAAEQ